jgi:hypothetical protein
LYHHDLVKVMPYLTYHHADGVRRPRPLHLSWNGFTAPREHPFWLTHSAPNGWRCHCYISAADGEDYARAQASGKNHPPAGWDKVDPKTGEQVGIDKGFGYAPGASVNTPLRSFVQDKLITYPPAITRALTKEVNRYVNASQSAAVFASEVLADKSRTEPLWLGFVENFEAVNIATSRDVKGYMVLLPSDAVLHADNSHGFDGGTHRAPVTQDYGKIWLVLNEADSLRAGNVSATGMSTVVALKKIGGEVFRCVFEVRHGKANRALVLQSLVIKK